MGLFKPLKILFSCDNHSSSFKNERLICDYSDNCANSRIGKSRRRRREKNPRHQESRKIFADLLNALAGAFFICTPVLDDHLKGKALLACVSCFDEFWNIDIPKEYFWHLKNWRCVSGAHWAGNPRQRREFSRRLSGWSLHLRAHNRVPEPRV